MLAVAEETSNPPPTLEPGHMIARVVKGEGKNLYTVALPDGKSLLAELPSRFRSTIWMKHGSFVVVDTTAFEDRENKLDGEIVNVVRSEKQWRKQTYWYAISSPLLYWWIDVSP
jgi:probable RNA-binding protein EIF1AD